jgi:hypothetical protein
MFLFNYILCILLLSSTVFGQVLEKGFAFKRHKQKSTTVPFKLVNNLIIIPVFINNSDTLRFILDTGVQSVLLTELSAGKTLHLNYVRKVRVQGLGLGAEVEAFQSYGNNFYFSGIEGKNVDMLILKEDIFFLSSKLGLQVHGLIGYDIFKNFIVEIDYDSEVLILHNPLRVNRKKLKGITLPLTIENTKPYLNASIVQDDSSKIAVKLIVDTGASHSVSLDRTDSSKIKLPNQTIESYLGKGISGDIKGKIGRILGLQVGNFQLLDIPASFPDSIYTKNVSGLAHRNGNLGADILRRFHVIFDYANQQLILRPSQRYKEPFNYNMSGIDVGTPMPGFPLYVISGVTTESPAHKAGLQTNDQIIAIDGNNVTKYTLNDILELFQSKPNKKIKLTVLRDTQTVKTTIVLKRPI